MPPVSAAADPTPLAYVQRGTNILQHVFRDHFARFAVQYDSCYAKELGNFRLERISRVATRFLTCGYYPLSGSGVYSRRESGQGVARIRCVNPECRHKYFRPFSCKGFFLCPSCRQKRTLLFAEYLDEQLLLALPHRQFVFTPWSGRCTDLPKALRVFLRHDQRLFAELARLIFNLIAQFYSTAAGTPISTAAVVAHQPFGDLLRFNPHSHALILEGGFDSRGRFYHLPIRDTARMAQCLRQRTVGLFLKLALITPQFAETLLCWKHSGFSVDNSVRLDGGDHKARQAPAQYVSRAPVSLQKLTYDRLGGRVLYHTAYNPYFKQNTSLWNAADFIAQLTQFIPRVAAGPATRRGAQDGGSPALGRTLRALLRFVLLPIQGALGESAPRRPRRPTWLEGLACSSTAGQRR